MDHRWRPHLIQKEGIMKPVILGKGGESINLLSRLVLAPPAPSAAVSWRPAAPKPIPTPEKPLIDFMDK
jgi:hypothetical protein